MAPSQVDAPPYSIANNNVRLPLSFRTMPVTARHYDGSLQYNTHNLYGLSQAAATARALHTLHDGAKRPFVLTRYAPRPEGVGTTEQVHNPKNQRHVGIETNLLNHMIQASRGILTSFNRWTAHI